MTYTNPYFPEATLTPDIYWANKPPQVRALRGMDPLLVGLSAKQLADQGFIIDVPIMVYQWEPVTVMGIRQQDGFTWVPSGKQPNIAVMPGLSLPGLPVYDPSHPPANSIKISIDAADYPAFDPPPPPPPPLDTHVVGAKSSWGNLYGYGPGAWADDPKRPGEKTWCINGKYGADINGQEVTQEGVTYVAHWSEGLMGETLDFTRKI